LGDDPRRRVLELTSPELSVVLHTYDPPSSVSGGPFGGAGSSSSAISTPACWPGSRSRPRLLKTDGPAMSMEITERLECEKCERKPNSLRLVIYTAEWF
jgi:hypothetical protein